MKRILVFISMLLCLSVVMAAGSGDDDCGKGNNNPNPNSDSTRHLGDEGTITQLPSLDPNDLIGPEGYDSVRWVSIHDVLNYTIRFENDAEFALANAQYVDVRFDFWNKVAMRGFGLGTFGFANRSWPIDKSPAAYQNRLDLRDSMQIYVDLTAGIDVTKQQGFWTFNSIDPETGVSPWQTDRGMLPINDSTHIGEGFVTFTLRPQDDLRTGDTISIQASIVFDTNDTIPTNRWCNKIDAGNPESKVAPLSPPEGGMTGNVYQLAFTAKDDEGGSGIKHVLLYMANHNGIYEEIDTVAVDSVLAFPVEEGKQYKLYSIAVDNTGNREPAKEEPDVILNFNQAPTDIALSDTIFQDDLAAGGFVGKLTTIDSEDEKTFTYALAEGNGAIHNDLFQINGSQLQAKAAFKSAEDSIYKIRISTTDEGGLSYSKAFTLSMKFVLERPTPDTLAVTICEGDFCDFHGKEYDQTGVYRHTVSNEYMRDSLYILQLTVIPRLDAPIVTVEGSHTLVSSAAKGNQWFYEDGNPVDGATEQKFTPTADGVYYVAVSNGSCYSEPSNAYRIQLKDESTLALELVEGWNWISSNIADENLKTSKEFLKPIADKVERFVGVESELINDPQYGLTGSLQILSPKDLYKLQMNETLANTWSGMAYTSEEVPFTLHQGWNWIGYAPIYELPLTEALTQLTPAENDVIKSKDAFATYSSGKWSGTLKVLTPGAGYMYWAGAVATFCYPTTRAFPVEIAKYAALDREIRTMPWNIEKHAYPDNMTIIASVHTPNGKAYEGAYTVGVFIDKECRGIGQYVDGKLFITIHGAVNESSSVTFKAYENVTGKEYGIEESLTFNGQHVGTMNNPYGLHIKGITGIADVTSNAYIIYPNPLRSRMFIQGATEQIKQIQVLSTSGEIMLSTEQYGSEGIDVATLIPGVYVVAITTINGIQYQKVVKAN